MRSCLLGLLAASAAAQSSFPDLLYYKFDEGSGASTANAAVPHVGAALATVLGQSLAPSGGQFGGALVGVGGASTLNCVNSGWATSLTGDFTLGFWIDLTAVTTPNPFMYALGDSSADLFRCFTNGAAGVGGILLKSGTWPGFNILGGASSSAPHHVAWVYEAGTATLHGYLDGVHVGSAVQPGTPIVGTGPFTVGGFATSTALLPGAKLDEFRLYSSALDAAQIAATWNVALPTTTTPIAYCTAGTSTNGCAAAMSAIGYPSVSATSGFTLRVTDVEGRQRGVIFYGISGRTAVPWVVGDSFYCVKSPLKRMGAQGSGGTFGACDGVFSVDWLAYVAANPTTLGAPFSAGEVINAQAWFRDPPSPKTTNTSNGLEFVLAP